MNLLSFKSYSMLKESVSSFESELDSILNESIGAALGNPIKFAKIKKNAKKYQQALVQQAINNLDFEKKKAAGNLSKDKADVLKAANAQKNQALKDQAGAISDRMDQLASTAGLKKVASIAKNKSKMAAAETALKTADGEEAKALKLQIKGLNQKVAQDQKELTDYAKDAKDDNTDEPKNQNLDNVKSDDKEAAEKEAADKKAAAEKEAADKKAAADKEAEGTQGAQGPQEPAAQEPAAQEPAAQEPAAQEPAAQEPAAQGPQGPQEPAAQGSQGPQEPAAQGAQGAQRVQDSLKTESYLYESIAEKFRRLSNELK